MHRAPVTGEHGCREGQPGYLMATCLLAVLAFGRRTAAPQSSWSLICSHFASLKASCICLTHLLLRSACVCAAQPPRSCWTTTCLWQDMQPVPALSHDGRGRSYNTRRSDRVRACVTPRVTGPGLLHEKGHEAAQVPNLVIHAHLR